MLLSPAVARLGSGHAAPQLHAEERPDVGRRWRNEPRRQETAPHAIGIVFENRKATRFPARGPFPVARPEAAPCLTVAGKEVLVFFGVATAACYDNILLLTREVISSPVLTIIHYFLLHSEPCVLYDSAAFSPTRGRSCT